MSLPKHQQRFMRVAEHFARHTEFLHFLSYSEEGDKWYACAAIVNDSSQFSQVTPVVKGSRGFNITLLATDEVKIAGYQAPTANEPKPDPRQLRIDDPELQNQTA